VSCGVLQGMELEEALMGLGLSLIDVGSGASETTTLLEDEDCGEVPATSSGPRGGGG
jgi:hypothetical protein